MNCSKCSRNAFQIAPLPPLCSSCFCRNAERRIRKDCRVNRWFRSNDIIFADSRLALFLVKRIVPGLPKKFVKSSSSATRIVLSETSDDIIAGFLDALFNRRKQKKHSKREIPLLRSLTDDEAAAFARLNRIRFVPKKKSPAVVEFVAALEAKYPEIRGSLMSALRELEAV